MSVSTCAELAARQLEAYNARDLDAFCACYADDVRVLDEGGAVSFAGLDEFRRRYEPLFAGWDEVHGEVTQRLVLEPHVIDDERWRRARAGERREGRVLVRYTAREGRISTVQFFREAT
jgi:hypothetical protein